MDEPEIMPRLAYAVHFDDRVHPTRFATKEAALRSARRGYRRTQQEHAVVWHNPSGVPKVWLAFVDAAGVRKTKSWDVSGASWAFEIDRGIILVIDLKTGRSVTNAAETVIAALARYFDLAAMRVIYRDTEDWWDGLAVRDGRFAGFVPIRTRDRQAAIDAARTRSDW